MDAPTKNIGMCTPTLLTCYHKVSNRNNWIVEQIELVQCSIPMLESARPSCFPPHLEQGTIHPYTGA